MKGVSKLRQITFAFPDTSDEDAEIIIPYITDTEIIEMFNRRDERALSEIQRRYGNYCEEVALNVLKNREDAELCLNDMLLRLWERIPPESPENLAGFAATTIKQIALNRYTTDRREKRGGSETDVILEELSEVVPSSYDVEKTFEKRELAELLNSFAGSLTPKKRNIFVLRYWYRMSVKDISERLAVSQSNILVTLMRIRKKLADKLKRSGMI